MRRTRELFALLILVVLGLAGCGDRGSLDADTLARAGNFQLGVEETAELIAPVPELPQDPAVIEALTDFWIDYSLLALAVNREGALEEIDLSALTRQHLNQDKVLQLRDMVIDVDTTVSDEELAEIYERDRPGERIRARHILLLFPDDAGQAQRDSVRDLAHQIRDRAAAGEDFASLAEQYSEDQGSAARGGDLNFFERGTMVPPFEEAAFALEPGEVSDVVESQFGLHVIRLEERDFPPLDEVAPRLRQEIQTERTARAESIFVAEIEEPAQITLADGARSRVRELAGAAQLDLSEREKARALVTFEGGDYPVREFRWFLLNQPTQIRQQIANATDDQLEGMLKELARGELLVHEAERRDITVPDEQVRELEEEIREQYREMAGLLGLDDITPEEGETLEAAVERAMADLLPRLVRGEQEVYPLGNLSLPLRDHYGVQISMENMNSTAQRVAALRDEDPDAVPGLGDLDDLDLEELVPDEPPTDPN